jgi:ClpP class serine protease
MNHIDATLLSRVWAIEPRAAAALEAQINSPHRLVASAVADMPVSAPFASITSCGGPSTSSPDKPYAIVNGVALIAVLSVMTKSPSYWYRGTSTKQTQAAIRHAARDKDVKAILILWDTPGGSVDGLQELFDEIVLARAEKTVTSYWEDNCFSAGCYCSFASSQVYMNAAGYCGSLGSMLVLQDASKAAEMNGYRFELLSTGPLKGQGSFGVPITPEGLAMFQRMVDHYGGNFRSAI